MKFAICQEMFVDWEWERQCDFIKEVGYTGIELAPFTLANLITDVSLDKRHQYKEEAEARGLQIIGLHWLLAKTEGLHLTTADESVRQATAEYARQLVNACADFGGDLMVWGSPFQRDVEEGMSTKQAYQNAAEILSAVMPTCEEREVKICMEPLTPKETNFLNTCAQTMELIEMVNHSHIVLHQDVKAMLGGESEPIPVLIDRYADVVGHFHVNDNNLLGPGMGETDYLPIFNALQQTNYSGWVSVEVFDYSPGCEKIARDSMSYMQDILKKM